MQFGVCTWTFNQPLATTAQTLAKLGFDGVELLGDLEQYSAVEARQVLSDNDLRAFSLTPANVDISHPDASIRKPAIDYFFRLVDFAAELGQPLISCHGLVGRIKAIGTQLEEDQLLVDAVRQIAGRADQAGLKVVFEVLNRYETHQIHNHEQALVLLGEVGLENFGILLDAYHMNIEEANPAEALRRTGKHLWLYHVADSNRAGIGYGIRISRHSYGHSETSTTAILPSWSALHPVRILLPRKRVLAGVIFYKAI